MKHPLPFITRVEQKSSKLLQRSRQHSESIATRPKFWLRWFIQAISSAWTEFLHPAAIHCLVPPHWHAMAHLFPWWLRYQRYLEVWPSMAQLKWLWFWFGSLCICRFGWSQLISSTSCDVQTYSELNCCVKDFLQVVLSCQIWGVSQQVLRSSDFGTHMKHLRSQWHEAAAIASHLERHQWETTEFQSQLTSTDQLRTKAINWWPSETRRKLRRKCQALSRAQTLWLLRLWDPLVRRVPGALCAPASLDTWAVHWRFAHWEPLENKSKSLREKQMNHRQAQHLLQANTS